MLQHWAAAYPFQQCARLSSPPPAHAHVLQVAAGLGHCLAVIADGSAVSWGWNSAGALDVPCCAVPCCAVLH